MSSSSRLQMALLPQYGWHWIKTSLTDGPSNWLITFIPFLQVNKPFLVQECWHMKLQQSRNHSALNQMAFTLYSSEEASFSCRPFPVKITQVTLLSNVPWLSLVPPDWRGKSNADIFIYWPRPESIKKLRNRFPPSHLWVCDLSQCKDAPKRDHKLNTQVFHQQKREIMTQLPWLNKQKRWE